ncbi:hypothetical protein P3T76_005680 [Phytophthora citrophthora]|uniref:Uncharacterized protein n=1 Tax=Phytophthora citrophthora TaxID=4793 RepID=A0AAD9LMT5_9STRA|nr:hypothetical protein P3T76_005680 [Phytophthora citrophthora]
MSTVSPDLTNTKGHSEWSLDDKEFELLAEEIGVVPTRSEIRKWPKELKDKRKLQLHCRRMLRFRTKRAAEKKTMMEEYFQLEQELEQQLVLLRNVVEV